MVEHEQTLLAEMLKESILQGTTPCLTIISNSMSPLLRSGDQVGLREMVPTQAQPGQIITFSSSNDGRELITHRVAGVVMENGEEKIATFGDRTLRLDSPVAHEAVIGQVIWRRREGHFVDLMNGQGAWLSEKLAHHANNNLERASGLHIGSSEWDNDIINTSNEICSRQRSRLSTRVYLRFSFLWASLLILYSEYLPHSGKTEDHAS